MLATRRGLTALFCSIALFGAACGSGGDDEASRDAVGSAADEAAATDGTGEVAGADTEPEGADQAAPPTIESQEVDVTVQYAGFRYEVVALEVEEQEDQQVRARGLEVGFAVSVANVGSDTATPRPDVSLQWDDDEDAVIQVPVQVDLREVPGDASSRGTFDLVIPPADLESWDPESARLVFGQSGVAQAVAPLGDEEPTDRLPIIEERAETFNLGGFQFDVVETRVRWDNVGERRQVEEGTALLEVWGEVVNGSGAQQCLRAGGRSIEPSIVLLDGTSRTTLGTNMNCLADGETERNVVVAFEIDDPFAGDYEMRLSDDRLGDDAVITFTLGEAGDAPAEDEDEDAEDEDEDAEEG